MKNIAIFIFIIINLCFHLELQAQRFAQNYWHKNGKVKLTDGTIYEGELKYDLENELIQLQVNGVLKTLTSRKVGSFEYYDNFEQRDRYFYALPFAKVSGYKTPTFFELLMQDQPITLLVRESLTTQTDVINSPYTINRGATITRTVIKYDFFFLYKNGKIVSFNGTKKGLLYLLKNREKDIKNYLKENRVNFENKRDLIDIIRYYNLQNQ